MSSNQDRIFNYRHSAQSPPSGEGFNRDHLPSEIFTEKIEKNALRKLEPAVRKTGKTFLYPENSNTGHPASQADKRSNYLANTLSNIFNFSTSASGQYEKKNDNNGSSGSDNNKKSSGSNNNKKVSNPNSTESNNNDKAKYSKNLSSGVNNSSSNKSNFLSEIFQMKNFEEKNKNDSVQKAQELENFKINLLKYNLTSKDPAINFNDNATLISNSVLNEALNNKLLKKLIVLKIDEIFASNDMNQKIALFNLVSNSNLCDDLTKRIDPNILTMNNNIELVNSMNMGGFGNIAVNHINNNVEASVDQVMKDNLQNEIIKSIIKNFCDFLNNNGYDIVQTNDRLKKKTQRNEDNNDENGDLSSQQMKKTKFAWLCSHTTRPHYARGKCKNCYLSYYHKKNKKMKDRSENGDDHLNKT